MIETPDVLEGITVVAIATNIPGPLAAARLRALGARVVKIEPLNGDPLERASAQWYAEIVNGLEVLRLNFRERGSIAALEAHLAQADLLITAMRARSLERIGIEWGALHARHPRLSYVSITGEAPPHDDRAGHDLTYQARAGTIAPPSMPRALIGDMAAAERAVGACLGALYARERTGAGTHANVSITDAALAFSEPYRHGLTREDGALGGALPVYALYPAQRGWVAVATLEPHFVERLQQMLAIDAVDAERLRAAFATKSADEWEALAQAHDVPLAAVR